MSPVPGVLLRRLGLLAVFGVAAVSCARRDDQPVGADLVSHSLADDPVTMHDPVQRVLSVQLGRMRYRISDTTAPVSAEFGLMMQGVLRADGVAAIGDQTGNRIAVIRADGGALRWFGRKGEGPGELNEPTRIVIMHGDTLGVFDDRLQRLIRVVANGDSAAFVDQHPFAGYMRDGCQFASGLTVIAFDRLAETTLQRLDIHGAVMRTFGSPFARGSRALNESVAQGPVGCLADSSVVIATPLGDMVRYRYDGTAAWHAKIDSFAGNKWDELPNHGIRVTYAPPPTDTSQVAALVAQLNDSLVLMQMFVETRVSANGKVSIQFRNGFDTRLLDLRTGRELGRQRDLPQILAVTGNQMLLIGEDPTPWVGVAPWRVAAPSAAGHRTNNQ